jgi:hypothetical protein
MQDVLSVENITATFKQIFNWEVEDPQRYLIWNVWRAIVSLGGCTSAWISARLEDLDWWEKWAEGSEADIVVEYGRDFVLLVEVTLLSGIRQYEAECEPITRHIGEYQLKERTRTKPRTVYGLFIAPTINPTTHNYFYIHLKHLAAPHLGGHVAIIPLTLAQFVDIFEFAKTEGQFSRHAFGKLLERLVTLKDSTTDGDQWIGAFPSVIEAWKQEVLSSGLN